MPRVPRVNESDCETTLERIMVREEGNVVGAGSGAQIVTEN